MTGPVTPQAGPAPRFLRMDRITNRIVMLTVGATLVPILAAGFLAYAQTRRAVTERIDEDLRSVSSLTARELDYWLRSQSYQIGVFASSFEVSQNLARVGTRAPSADDARARLTDYLSSVSRRMDFYSELMVLDAEGLLVTSSDPGRRALPPELVFDRPLRGAGTELGEPHAGPEGTYRAPLLEPILAPGGAGRLGTLVAQLDLARLSEILGAFKEGAAGRVLLLREGGTVLTTSDATLEPAASFDPADLATLIAAGEGVAERRDAEGRARLSTLARVPQSDWVVVAEVGRREAYAPLVRARNLTAVAMAGLILLVGGMVHVLGVILIRPLDRLTAGAAEVAAGNLSVGLPPGGRGEVGYLTEVFNEMVRRLRAGRDELDAANLELRERNAELALLSVTDGLTGLLNHRRGMEVLSEELDREARSGGPLSVLMIDVDHFKQYNDSWGHPEGDAVLKGVARALQQATRGVDGVVRYGGEEFMVVLPDCDAEGAMEAGTRILERLSREPFTGGPVTLSAGAAVYPSHGTEAHELVRAADEALYTAKRNGRNRVVLAEGAGLPVGSRYRAEMVGTRAATPA